MIASWKKSLIFLLNIIDISLFNNVTQLTQNLFYVVYNKLYLMCGLMVQGTLEINWNWSSLMSQISGGESLIVFGGNISASLTCQDILVSLVLLKTRVLKSRSISSLSKGWKWI